MSNKNKEIKQEKLRFKKQLQCIIAQTPSSSFLFLKRFSNEPDLRKPATRAPEKSVYPIREAVLERDIDIRRQQDQSPPSINTADQILSTQYRPPTTQVRQQRQVRKRSMGTVIQVQE